MFCFFKQKTAYELRISDWSSDVCSSDLVFILITGVVDDGEIDAQQVRLPLPPVAGHAGLVVDQRQLLADEPVEKGVLAYIGASDDGNGGQHERPYSFKL